MFYFPGVLLKQGAGLMTAISIVLRYKLPLLTKIMFQTTSS